MAELSNIAVGVGGGAAGIAEGSTRRWLAVLVLPGSGRGRGNTTAEIAFVEAAVASRAERCFLVSKVGRFGDVFGAQVGAQVAVLVRCAFVAPTTRDLAAVHARGDDALGLTEGDHFWGELIAGDLANVLHVRADVRDER